MVELLYQTAVPLDPGPDGMDRNTEFCLGDTCTSYPPKRVSVCEAVRETACDSTPCEISPECNTVPAHAGLAPDLPTDWTMFGGFESLSSTLCSGDCGTGIHDTQIAVPSVGPQPLPGCDVCMLDLASAQLWVTIDPRLAEISSTIVLTTTDGRNNLQSRIPRPAGAPYPTRFSSPVMVLPSATFAYLDFVMADGTILLDSRTSIPVR
jgi:hypothetical protein